MKSYRILCAVILTMTMMDNTHAQIPNAGFETWPTSEPDGWVTSNAAPAYTNVTKSMTAHTGSSAIRGDVVGYSILAIAPIIQSGPGGHGFAYAQRPASVTGWYQFSATGGDRFGINVELFKGGESGTLVALAASADPTLHGSYTQFTAPFTYFTSDVPDLCIMQFSVALPNGASSTHVGSYFLLDDLAFGGATGVTASPAQPGTFRLEQNYPNPFNPGTVISYTLPAAGHVLLRVYNLLGQLVATPVNSWQTAGEHILPFDARNLTSGVYLYRLSIDGASLTRTMTLMH